MYSSGWESTAHVYGFQFFTIVHPLLVCIQILFTEGEELCSGSVYRGHVDFGQKYLGWALQVARSDTSVKIGGRFSSCAWVAYYSSVFAQKGYCMERQSKASK